MKLFVAVPSHNQMLSSETVVSLLKLQGACLQRGWGFAFEIFGGAVIQEVRNAMAGWFLRGGWDAMLMLDADQGVQPETVIRMVEHGGEVVGAFIPRRLYDWTAVRAGESDIGRARLQATPFVGVLADPSGSFQMTDGFVQAKYVGAGVLLVRRAALERMRGAYPELRGRGFKTETAFPRDVENWGFFNVGWDEEKGSPLGEDFAFCQRYRAAGGTIWADVVSRIVHVGRQVFEGSFLEHLMARGDVSINEGSPGSSPPA